jgi:hypothetical protein
LPSAYIHLYTNIIFNQEKNNSRTYRGLSPGKMRENLPDTRICNYGFSGTGFEERYLSVLPGLFTPGGRKKIIVLGITPLSLTPSACKNNGFLMYREKSVQDLWMIQVFGPFLYFFRPYDTEALYNQLMGKGTLYYQYYHADGWVASYTVPERQDEALPLYKGYFKNNKVSVEICRNLFEWTAQMRLKNITVIGFRPPAGKAMIELEKTDSGFDEESFVRDFIRAGGIWFSFPHQQYHSYDGSHLTEKSAVQLSYDLSKKIADYCDGSLN